MQLNELIAHTLPYRIADAMEIDKRKIGGNASTPTPTLMEKCWHTPQVVSDWLPGAPQFYTPSAAFQEQ